MEKQIKRRRLSCKSPILANLPPRIEEKYIEQSQQNSWYKHYVTATGAGNGFYQIKDGSFVIAILPDYFDIDKGNITKKEAEAVLISAVPDMLEGHKKIDDLIGKHMGAIEAGEYDFETITEILVEIQNNSRAAINKASNQ